MDQEAVIDQEVRASRMTPRYVKKREVILQAAAQVFNKSGVSGATLSDVASQVGLSANSVTYYYKKKEDLVVACMLQTLRVMNDIIAVAAQSASIEERVRQFIRLYFVHLSRVQSGKAPEMMRLRDVQSLRSPHAEVIFSAYRDMFRGVRRLLSNDVPQKQDRDALNARAFHLMMQTVGAMGWGAVYDSDDYELIADHMSDVLIGGLALSRSEWGGDALDAKLTHVPEGVETAQDAFLRAATALINKKDYRGASVQEISASLSVTKGSFYHYNLNKEDLILACFERTFSVVRRMQTAALQAEGSGWSKLSALSRALVRYHMSEKGPLLRMNAWSELPEEVREGQRQTMERLEQRYSILLSQGMRDGSIRPVNQAVAAMMIRVMLDMATIVDHWVPSINAENSADLFVRPLFLGILLP